MSINVCKPIKVEQPCVEVLPSRKELKINPQVYYFSDSLAPNERRTINEKISTFNYFVLKEIRYNSSQDLNIILRNNDKKYTYGDINLSLIKNARLQIDNIFRLPAPIVFEPNNEIILDLFNTSMIISPFDIELHGVSIPANKKLKYNKTARFIGFIQGISQTNNIKIDEDIFVTHIFGVTGNDIKIKQYEVEYSDQVMIYTTYYLTESKIDPPLLFKKGVISVEGTGNTSFLMIGYVEEK
jgi:hypothetical protein